MSVSPDLDGFRALAAERRVVPVHARYLADTETAVGLYAKLSQNRPGSYLLESAEQGVWSRYSFIGVRSVATLTEQHGQAVWTGHTPAGMPSGGDPLAALRETLALLHTPHLRAQGDDPLGSASDAADLPPFTSGLVGFLGYDAVRRVEQLPDGNPRDLDIPELGFLLVSDLAVLDHHTSEVWLVANAINFDGTDARVDEAHADAVARIEAMAALLAQPTPSAVVSARFDAPLPVRRQRTPQEFQDAVRAAVEEIKAGEAFQVVVSQRFEVDTSADALEVYRVLRLTNPSPYMYLVRLEDADGRPFDIVGSSPEALVTVSQDRATIHPIAGTRPRGADPVTDAALVTELLADPKERAEHVMLVDLARNDLGRICRPGSVEVLEFGVVERYSHVWHIVSTVSGTVAADKDAFDVFRAVFPHGTVSGAPKVRAMQLLEEIEPVRRGIYAGAVGYFDSAGDMDLAIAIRTAVMAGGVAYVQAGAGVVADSVPANEEAETRNKARAVLQAIATAETLKT